jgi:hypothetical protein
LEGNIGAGEALRLSDVKFTATGGGEVLPFGVTTPAPAKRCKAGKKKKRAPRVI